MYYENYHCFIVFQPSTGIFVGRVNNVKNVEIAFTAPDIHELKTTFHAAIDAYIDTCAREGVFPEAPFELN